MRKKLIFSAGPVSQMCFFDGPKAKRCERQKWWPSEHTIMKWTLNAHTVQDKIRQKAFKMEQTYNDKQSHSSRKQSNR